MHGSVREGLEGLLSAKPDAACSVANVQVAVGHVAECGECARELTAMRAHAEMFCSLKPPADFEPSAGFYARVLQRIEQSARRSIWWVFAYSPVGKRLAYCSLTIAVALGSYVVCAEEFDGHLQESVATVKPTHSDALVFGTRNDQRQAVLANFITHPATLPQ